MLENYVDVIEASKILDVHPETVKRLIREGKLTATKFGNKWIMEYNRVGCSPTPMMENAEGRGDCCERP